MSLLVKTHTQPAVFADLESEWLDLLERAVTNEIFLTPQFLSTWWENLGQGKLKIITCRKPSGQLVGLAPLFIHENEHQIKQLSFIGCEAVSDYLDFIVDRELINEVYPALVSAISQLGFSSVNLCSLPSQSPTLKLLPELFKKNLGIELQAIEQTVTPVLKLPPSWEEYLNQLDRKPRQEIRRKERKLSAQEPTHRFELIQNSYQLEKHISSFIQLHQQSSQEKAEFWNPSHIGFFQSLLPKLAQHDWLKLYFLSVSKSGERRQVSTMLIFDYKNNFYLYNSGYNPEFTHLSAGQVLTAHTIRQSIEQGKTFYNFLRGNEKYKLQLGGVVQPIYNLTSSATSTPLPISYI